MESSSAPSLETVLSAISALYDNPNAAENQKASQWLGEVQKSIHSWKIADELLQQKHDMKSCYFAAQTMRSKIQHSFFELPVEAHPSLRDSLVNYIMQITPDTNTVIVTQLCLALADLALQMPSWNHCVQDMISKFSQNTYALLEILKVIPQEVDSSVLKLGENRRQDIKNELKNNSNTVVTFLKDSLSSSSQNPQAALKIIQCLTSWIQVRAIALSEIPNNFVISQCFHILADHMAVTSLHDAATDCICALLNSIEEDSSSSPDDQVERLIFNTIYSLENSYHMSVAREEQKANNYSRLFTELAETFLLNIVQSYEMQNEHFALKSLDLVLICVGHHDYEVAEITFNVWYRLSEELYQRDQQSLTDIFKPYIERLVLGLARHCQMEPDHTGLLDESDDFCHFRLKVFDLIKDVIFIMGSSNCFRRMFLGLQAGEASWEQSEAALYVMQAVAKCIIPEIEQRASLDLPELPKEEYEVVPKVVEAILRVSDDAHLAVRKTCVLLLGELCEWIDYHSECLEPALQYVLRALQVEELASYAATALQSICKACRHHMTVHLHGLLQIVRSLDTFKLSSESAIGLLRGVAAIISRLPLAQVRVAMQEATSVQLEGLKVVMQSDAGAKKGTATDPAVWLDRLAAIFREIELKSTEEFEQHPCLPALSDAWPILSSVMDKYKQDGRVMERLCRVLRFALRTIKSHSAPLLQPLVVKMVEVYYEQHHSCVLYLGSILVDELAGVPECVPVLVDMLQALAPQVFSQLHKPDGLTANPDTVDDLFRLCVRFLQRVGAPLLRSAVLPAVMQCALVACALDHRDAHSSVMKFFYDLIHLGQSRRSDQALKALIDSTLEQYGAALVSNLLHSSVHSIRPHMLAEVADVLVELSAWRREPFSAWLLAALGGLRKDTPGVACATTAQMRGFHEAAVRAETSKEMFRLLENFARLYR